MSGSDLSPVELQRLMLLSDSDMAEAAQQLMQLSGEDSNSSTSMNSNGNNKKIKLKAKMMKRKGLFQKTQSEITSATIEETFEKEEISRPTKAPLLLEFEAEIPVAKGLSCEEQIPVAKGLSRKRNSNGKRPLPHMLPKKPRYRLIESIYKEIKPVKVRRYSI